VFVSVELVLGQRMEYLSRAAVCAKSSTSRVLAPGDGEFLHDLEDKMEVKLIIICHRFHLSDFWPCGGNNDGGVKFGTEDNRLRTRTHPFNGPFSRYTQLSRYQKGKTNLDFTEARDSEWQ